VSQVGSLTTNQAFDHFFDFLRLFSMTEVGPARLGEDGPTFFAVYDFLIFLISFDCFSNARFALT
jgi:hypothetical protein